MLCVYGYLKLELYVKMNQNKMLARMKYNMVCHFILDILAPHSLIIALCYSLYTCLDFINVNYVDILSIEIDITLIVYVSVLAFILRLIYFVCEIYFEKRYIEKICLDDEKN